MSTYEKTYCNPIKVEDYPKGYESPDHRSLADPTVLYENGKWYMYPSYGMAYVSEDFITWDHIKIEPEDLGYAPTVVKFNGKFILCSKPDISKLYIADNPLGPFKFIGEIKYENGEKIDGCDPMLFADDDGRMYMYWTEDPADHPKRITIYGIELDKNDLTHAIGKKRELIIFDNNHTWECHGARNQNTTIGWIEGAWMIKRNGRYYLTYSGCGTQFATYAMGAYYSDESPLSGFVYQKKNPINGKSYGLVPGGGHGCIVEGPNDTLWAFYTCPISYSHPFERRIGMDPATIDENGEIVVLPNTDQPQWAPGVKPFPYADNDAGLLPLTIAMPVSATSCAPGRDAVYAVDESLLSWWQPCKEDNEKTLTVELKEEYLVSAIRVIWRDVGINYANGALPGAFKYKVEVSKDGNAWKTVVDKQNNTRDFAVDYETFETCKASFVRLVITGTPENIEAGVISFTAFGKHE